MQRLLKHGQITTSSVFICRPNSLSQYRYSYVELPALACLLIVFYRITWNVNLPVVVEASYRGCANCQKDEEGKERKRKRSKRIGGGGLGGEEREGEGEGGEGEGKGEGESWGGGKGGGGLGGGRV